MHIVYRPIAAIIMFTKLPLWKVFPNIPGEAYRHVVTWWPLSGWLSALVCGFTYWLLSIWLPTLPAALFAICARLLFTGAYHEDGVADFFDGFGGGTSKERILAIMKDSHIGTYGVIALISCMGAMITLLSSIPGIVGAFMIAGADPWAKFCSGRMLSVLKYAREETGSKNRAAYPKPNLADTFIAFTCGVIPMIIISCFYSSVLFPYLYGMIASSLISSFLFLYMKRKIGGYTGDCCGAVCILAEISFCLTFVITCL